MKKVFSSIPGFVRLSFPVLIWIVTIAVSITAYIYFWQHGQETLSNYDAISRLNSARKVIDSITPGLGQLGGVWLPFPQVLMIPFIWQNELWRTGLAGYFISGLAFVFGAVYLEKTVYLLSNKRAVSLLVWLMFVSNVNVLLLQTMAMSEMFFMGCLIMTIYFLLRWIRTHDIVHFLQAAFFIMVLTLTRYEGYFVLAGAFLVVVVECIRAYRKDGKDKIEGMILLFLSVASFGIILWCIYSALFYKDPFFWLHTYSTSTSSVIQNKDKVVDTVFGELNPSLPESFNIYAQIMTRTIGSGTIVAAILGVLMYVYDVTKKKLLLRRVWQYMPVAIISLALFVLLIVGYFIGFIPHIEFPPVLLKGLEHRDWSVYADNNIRYGIVLLPCILLFGGLAAARSRFFLGVVLAVTAVQIYFSITSPMLLQYPFKDSWRYPQSADAAWFSQHYTGGLILMSNSRHEDFIFQSGLQYKDFIYEGTRGYWTDSLQDPARYAHWVIYDDKISGDNVTLGMTKEGFDALQKKFTKVYDHNGLKIYKLNLDES